MLSEHPTSRLLSRNILVLVIFFYVDNSFSDITAQSLHVDLVNFSRVRYVVFTHTSSDHSNTPVLINQKEEALM